MNNEIDKKIDVTAILFLLGQNRQQAHNWTLIWSGGYGIGIQECEDNLNLLKAKERVIESIKTNQNQLVSIKINEIIKIK